MKERRTADVPLSTRGLNPAGQGCHSLVVRSNTSVCLSMLDGGPVYSSKPSVAKTPDITSELMYRHLKALVVEIRDPSSLSGVAARVELVGFGFLDGRVSSPA